MASSRRFSTRASGARTIPRASVGSASGLRDCSRRTRAPGRAVYHARMSSAARPVLLETTAARFDGWRMVAFGGIAQGLALPLLGAYGIVATPLIQEYGATATELGIGMSLALFAAALAGPPLGVALDRGPLRAIML